MTNGHLTADARAALDRYVDEVRATLSGSELDVEEVTADIRDHVLEAAIAAGVDRMDRAGLEDVLERLGPPARWAREQDEQGWQRFLVADDDRRALWLSAGVFALTFVGVALFPWVGPLILIAAWVLARVALAAFAFAGRPAGYQSWMIYPPLVLVGAGIAGLLLLWPLPLIAELAGGVVPTPRAWAGVAFGLGVWWVVLGFAIRTWTAPFRWMFRPLSPGRSHGSILAATGLALALAGGLLMLWA